jgi:nucleoside-diphosphate-sugar epimerase
MVKKYLVTGGSGFIGSALVKRLLLEGHEVSVLDDNSRGHPRRLEGVLKDLKFINGDIRDAETVKKAVHGHDVVCHLAYVNGTKFFYSQPHVVLDVAVKGMTNVLDACIAHNVRELILASSSEVYQFPPVIPTDETAPLVVPDVLNPRFSYGGGKIISELMAINYGRHFFDRVVIFRPHNVYGPDMGWEHVIPEFCLRMMDHKDGSDFPIQGSGEEKRAFIYIDDFTEGLMLVINKGEHLGIYHIGTQEEVTMLELAQATSLALGKSIKITPGPLQPGSVIRRCPDIGKLRRLGFEPKWLLRNGVIMTSQWYTNNINLRGNFI